MSKLFIVLLLALAAVATAQSGARLKSGRCSAAKPLIRKVVAFVFCSENRRQKKAPRLFVLNLYRRNVRSSKFQKPLFHRQILLRELKRATPRSGRARRRARTLLRKLNKIRKQCWLNLFDRMDRNGDGIVSIPEFFKFYKYSLKRRGCKYYFPGRAFK